ncbi:hypothetical protein N9Y17_00555 [Gammaproteobacteria bacterium]|nr:hypothetical protein [Gammaproteobacteria bacterium]
MRQVSYQAQHLLGSQDAQSRYGILFVSCSADYQRISCHVVAGQDLIKLNGSDILSVRQLLKHLYHHYQLTHQDDLLVESQFITLTRLLVDRSSQLTIIIEQAHLLSWSVIALFLKLAAFKSNKGLIQIVMSGSPAIRAKCQILSETLT